MLGARGSTLGHGQLLGFTHLLVGLALVACSTFDFPRPKIGPRVGLGSEIDPH